MAQTINVDMTPGAGAAPTIFLSQGDVGRSFTINLLSRFGDSIPAGSTVKIQGTKPSGLGFIETGTVTNNSVAFTSTAIMTDEAGRFLVEIEITKNSNILGTANFFLQCEENPHPDGTTDGMAEQLVPEITLLVERAEDAAERAEAAIGVIVDGTFTFTDEHSDGNVVIAFNQTEG